jgi:hypothetical protein
MSKRSEQEYYSLMNVTNGNILSAHLNSMSWSASRKEVHVRQRNFKISQFQTESSSVLKYFINNEDMDTRAWCSMGIHEIWVKEEDIDELYLVLALACLCNFSPSWDKNKALVGAFLFHKDPQLFLTEDFMGTYNSATKVLKNNHLGKEFLEFLESFNVLSFIKERYGEGANKRSFFSTSELDLIKRERKDIITKFEHINEEARAKANQLKLLQLPQATPHTIEEWSNNVATTAMNLMNVLNALRGGSNNV